MRSMLKKLDHDRIVAAIREAESRTSGEIRVHLHHRKVADVMEAARKVFHRLGMPDTHLHNGVLLFVAPRSRQFAILGDRAIHERCGDDFWKGAAAVLEEHFRARRFTEGVVATVEALGRVLAEHFPPIEGRHEELADEVDES